MKSPLGETPKSPLGGQPQGVFGELGQGPFAGDWQGPLDGDWQGPLGAGRAASRIQASKAAQEHARRDPGREASQSHQDIEPEL